MFLTYVLAKERKNSSYIIYKMKEKEVLEGLDTLNDDVLEIIYSHLGPEVLWSASRENYVKYHHIVRSLIPSSNYDSYVRDMVRNDLSFVFHHILLERFDDFHKWKKFYFNNNMYPSYLIFLRNFAIDHKSHKCLHVLDQQCEKKGFEANWYKRRNSIKLAREWRN